MFTFCSLLPETKGLSLEEMDIIFGAVSSEALEALIQKEERALEGNEASPQSDEMGGRMFF